MRFNNEQERLDLIQGFKEQAESLTKSMKAEIPEKTKVLFESITEWDEEEKDGCLGGNIYVCYIKQPHIMTAVILMDKLAKRDFFNAGYTGWDAMVIPPPISSKEINEYSIKLGLTQKIAQALDLKIPDIKKN